MLLLPDVQEDLSTFEAVVRRMYWYYRAEGELFRVLGLLSVQPPEVVLDDSKRVGYATQSRYHGWHSELWFEQLPTVGQAFGDLASSMPESSSVIFSNSSKVQFGSNELIEDIYQEVLPGLVHVYESHLETASPMSDGPIIKVLHTILATSAKWALCPMGRSRGA